MAWNAPAETLCDLDGLTKPFILFKRSAREAAALFPQNANVAVITSLAGIGIDRTRIVLIADPNAALNSHGIQAEGDFGTLEIRVRNRPLKGDPKSSEMAALNIVRLMENRFASLVV